jgi:hypothetical protein
MDYVRLERAGKSLTTELKGLGINTIVDDLENNLTKLAQYATGNIGKDIKNMVEEFKPKPLKDEHPYCWLVWIARGCHFITTACKHKVELKVKASTAIKNAYNQTLIKHHNMMAVGVSKASFVFLENTLDSSNINWNLTLDKTQVMLEICERNGVIYL